MAMFPVHVLVETVRPHHCISCSHDGHPVLDTFAIVNGQTVLKELVENVLNALGRPELVADSRGLIQVNNWKPLTFEDITDNLEEPIVNLLKDISQHVTLKIITKSSDSPSAECVTEYKQKLLNGVASKQPQLLEKNNGRILRDAIQTILSNDDAALTTEQQQEIQDWLEQLSEGGDNRRKSVCGGSSTHVAFNQLSEIPTLEKWFKRDPNPSRQKLMHYVNTLNNSPARRAISKVNYQQICNWFANQRATSRSSVTPAPSEQLPHIPVATTPVDIRTKFSASNGYTSGMDRPAETDRIDGGSESPNGHDEASDQSISDTEVKESMASSPDQAPLSQQPPPSNNSNHAPVTSSLRSDSAQEFSAENLSAIHSLFPGGNFSQFHQLASLFAGSPVLPHISMPTTVAASSQISGLSAAQSFSHANSLNSVSSSHAHTPSRATHEKTPVQSTPSNENHHDLSNSSNNNGTPGGQNVARSRLMFDPLTELPILERWFDENPHPGWLTIEQYTETLNGLQYRQNYPPISTHNVKIWFKNRRAKCKRLLTNDANKVQPGDLKFFDPSKLDVSQLSNISQLSNFDLAQSLQVKDLQ